MLPLHVFEERYRALVRDLVAHPRKRGVRRRRDPRGARGRRRRNQSLHPVGCLAELRQVEPHPDGRFDIVATGARRFRIDSVDAASKPYLQAEVEFLDEPDGDAAAVLANPVAELWAPTGRR